jgi:hypothetical protein
MKSKRKATQARRQRKKLYKIFGWSTAGLIALIVLVYIFITASRPIPEQEETVAIMPDTSHVPEGSNPGPYNSDPPTSGRHYESTLKAGFFNQGDVQGEYPEGNLVHNLEHGYVIFWYNCALLDEGACSTLKEQIQSVLERENLFKVIAFPWASIDTPVVMTSWGKMMRFEEFDPDQAQAFVRRNRNKAPEPNAP